MTISKHPVRRSSPGGAVSLTLNGLIIAALASAGAAGLTCEEIEAEIGRSHQAVSGNLRHLVERGLARHNGEHGTTKSGRRAMNWVAA